MLLDASQCSSCYTAQLASTQRSTMQANAAEGVMMLLVAMQCSWLQCHAAEGV
jgi:hypothetical protein